MPPAPIQERRHRLREPPLRLDPELRATENFAHAAQRGGSGAPHEQRATVQPEHIHLQMRKARVALEQREIKEQTRARGPRAAGASLDVLMRERIVEVVRTHFDTETAATNRHSPFELIETHVHTAPSRMATNDASRVARPRRDISMQRSGVSRFRRNGPSCRARSAKRLICLESASLVVIERSCQSRHVRARHLDNR